MDFDSLAYYDEWNDPKDDSRQDFTLKRLISKNEGITVKDLWEKTSNIREEQMAATTSQLEELLSIHFGDKDFNNVLSYWLVKNYVMTMEEAKVVTALIVLTAPSLHMPTDKSGHFRVSVETIAADAWLSHDKKLVRKILRDFQEKKRLFLTTELCAGCKLFDFSFSLEFRNMLVTQLHLELIKAH